MWCWRLWSVKFLNVTQSPYFSRACIVGVDTLKEIESGRQSAKSTMEVRQNRRLISTGEFAKISQKTQD